MDRRIAADRVLYTGNIGKWVLFWILLYCQKSDLVRSFILGKQ